MSQIVHILYKGRKIDIAINQNETLRSVMTKAFDKIGIIGKFYTKDKYIFKNGDTILNGNENDLNCTVEMQDIIEDDNLELIKTEGIKAGNHLGIQSLSYSIN
jgi:hypothetical protein